MRFLLFLLLAGCEAKGACDTPQLNRCADHVAKSACVLQGPNHEVSRFSKDKTCRELGYGPGGAGQRNDALGIGVFVPPGASVLTSSDTEMIRWLVDDAFPVLCAITVAPRDAHPRSLADAKAAFEKSGAFKAAESSEDAGTYTLSGRKVSDPGLMQIAVRRAGATRSVDATCTGPIGHAAELRAVVSSVAVD